WSRYSSAIAGTTLHRVLTGGKRHVALNDANDGSRLYRWDARSSADATRITQPSPPGAPAFAVRTVRTSAKGPTSQYPLLLRCAEHAWGASTALGGFAWPPLSTEMSGNSLVEAQVRSGKAH